MNRTLLLVLVTVVVAGIVGTLMARDPGYVMVAHDGHMVQTSLWVFIGLLVVVCFGAYYLVRFVGGLLAAVGVVRAWRSERQSRNARQATARGLLAYTQGDFQAALKHLKRAAPVADYPAVNYLFSARAADRLGDRELREQCLRLAVETDPASMVAIQTARAEMELGNTKPIRALESLKDVPDNELVLKLKSEAMLATSDWQGLSDLMPVLQKSMKDSPELFDLQKSIALRRLESASNDDALAIIFKRQPERVRHDEAVISMYCRKLNSEVEAEVAVREALNREWLPHLLTLYGSLGTSTLKRRLKTAENWLRRHPEDGALQYCLGELYESAGDAVRAREAYQKSIDLGGARGARARLGRLLAFDGHYKESSEQLVRALTVDGDSSGSR